MHCTWHEFVSPSGERNDVNTISWQATGKGKGKGNCESTEPIAKSVPLQIFLKLADESRTRVTDGNWQNSTAGVT